jgi:hypothetical protein
VTPEPPEELKAIIEGLRADGMSDPETAGWFKRAD